MKHYPLLEALRTDRQRAEEEASAPVRARLADSEWHLRRAREGLAALERAAFTDLGKHVLARIGADVGRELAVAITKAVASIRPRSRKRIATVRVPLEALRFADPESIERVLLEHWIREAPAKLGVDAHFGMSEAQKDTVVLTVTIPAITRGHVIAELP